MLLLCVPDVGHEGIEIPQSRVSWVCGWLRGRTGNIPRTSWQRRWRQWGVNEPSGVVLKVDMCSEWEAAESAIGESPIILVTVTGGTAVNFDEMLKLQTFGVERSGSTAIATSEKIIQSQMRFNGLNKQANLYFAARTFGLLEFEPVLDHEKSQVRKVWVRVEHVVHPHKIDLISSVECLTACKDGTGKGALNDAENRVKVVATRSAEKRVKAVVARSAEREESATEPRWRRGDTAWQEAEAE